MEAIQFKRAELEDQEIIAHYFEHHTSRSCERTFANVYLWSRQYPVKWAIVQNALVFKSEDENHVSFAYPAGAPEDVKNALEEMMEYSKEKRMVISIAFCDFALWNSDHRNLGLVFPEFLFFWAEWNA